MNKADLIKVVAEGAGISKTEAKKAVEVIMDSVADVLAKGEKVSLAGFGTFSVAQRAARQGINPQTKEVINIKAKKAVKFKAGVELNKKLN